MKPSAPLALPPQALERRRALLRGGSLVLLLGAHQIARGAGIVAVRVWPAEDYSRVTIESDTALKASYRLVETPPRLAVDIDGLTLDPTVVYEAWCSQRPGGIIVMIEEIHGRPVKAGESFSAAHIVGYFDSIEDMHAVYDRHKGHRKLVADESGWRLEK